jgi:hypothetical protein
MFANDFTQAVVFPAGKKAQSAVPLALVTNLPSWVRSDF